MAVLHAIFGLYAALDRAVVESQDPRVADVVERYLPGTTGENAGWSFEIQHFLNNLGTTPVPFPDVRAALDELLGTADVRPDDDSESRPAISAPYLGRMVYAIGALLHLPADASPLPDPSSETLYFEALGLAGPSGGQGMATGESLANLLMTDFYSRADWDAFTNAAKESLLLSEDVARWRPCNARLLMIGDLLCVDLITEFEDLTLDIKQVKAILAPENWPAICTYFCKLLPKGPSRPNGWTPYLELVSTTCPELCLTTALKFYFGEVGSVEAHVIYDLDDTPPVLGDGFVKWDKGYLNVAAVDAKLDPSGVHVLTRKVVHISGLSPVAQYLFTCISGYGSMSEEMILGGAKNPPTNPKAWKASRPTTGNGSGGSQQQQGQPTPTPTPTNPAQVPVSAAVGLVTDCVKEVTAKASAIAQKWTTGTLTPADVVEYSAFLGGRAASDPWRFAELFSKPSTTSKGQS